ncbi:MAG: cytochrome c3 family protein [Calditrichaceae bacterium]
MKPFYLTIIIAILCVAVYVFAGAGDEPASELIFSHKLHIEDVGAECVTCHSGAEKSVTGKDNLLPDMETCSACHDVEDEDNCSMCHSNLDEAAAVPRIENYSPKFSHQLHLAADLQCLDCHSSIKDETAPAAVASLPSMSACMDCHEAKSASVECSACHLPGEDLKPVSHTVNFIHSHSDLARNGVDEFSSNMTCATCHQQSFCQKCHEGENLDNTTHPMNYAFTHALEAQGKEKTCTVCHQDRQFCNDCVPNTGGLHVMEAENDLESCISCHEMNAQEVCQPCHQQE